MWVVWVSPGHQTKVSELDSFRPVGAVCSRRAVYGDQGQRGPSVQFAPWQQAMQHSGR